MSSQPVQDIENALRDMQALAKGSGSSTSSSSKKAGSKAVARKSGDKKETATKGIGNPFVWLLKKVLSFALLIVLPFMMLIRVSLSLNVDYGVNVWLSLIAGIGATTLILLIYAAFLKRRLMGTWEITGRMSKMLTALVILYCGYSLIYLSGTNVKSEEVRDTYLSLHPVLRVATSTLILADRSLVVTDMARTPEAYTQMGLPVRENSLHYKQPDSGFVEAVDIRTVGRSEILNQFIRFYYWSMGFKTLRHSGTADHLHISVPQ